MHIRQVDRTQGRRYVALRRDHGVSDGTIRREIAILNAAIAEAVKSGWAEYVPPLQMPPKPPSRDRLATPEEIKTFMAAIEHNHLYVYAMLALHTLSRPGAILDLTWDRVDFTYNRIEFNEKGTVNGKKRRVNIEMNDALRRCMQEEKKKSTCDYVVSYKNERVKSLKRSFAATAKKAGLLNFVPYTIRHTGISQLVMAGVSVDEVARIARDDPKTIRENYLKYSPDFTHKGTTELSKIYGDL